MVIYFAKINLNSKHIYDVYDNKLKINHILEELFSCLKDGEVYVKSEFSSNGIGVLSLK